MALAHPLGNFTVSHFARLEIDTARIKLRYIVDLAEVSTFQEVEIIDSDGDRSPSQAEKDAYLNRIARQYADNLILMIDGARIPLQVAERRLSLQPGDGGLPTLRVECELIGEVPAGGAIRRLRFEDANARDRSGWREIVVEPAAGIAVFDSTAYGNGVSDELRTYPKDGLNELLNERNAELSFTVGAVGSAAAIPSGAHPLRMRDGRQAEVKQRDRLSELIAVPELDFQAMLWGLLVAALLGALHAMSPGHGKTVVGAYLVGSRGTARHAAFLGLTVTITHTAGVFALGLVTLAGSQYFLPEKMFPVLSLISGALVVSIGLGQIVRRLRATLGFAPRKPEHPPHTHHHHGLAHAHTHSHGDSTHDHGPHGHSHAPPERVTWRSLLALGISGRLLPCPSALVVLLAAISLHRVGYGLLLVLAFSAGLAGALTAVGLLFIYTRRLLHRPLRESTGWLTNALPVMSALVITGIGAAICYEALAQTGLTIAAAVAVVGAILSLRG